jgi:hydroxymethylglutaryl-CoA reductase (NADPH)
MRWQAQEFKAEIPMHRVGPVKIISDCLQEEVLLPLATFEAPLWPSTHRGAKTCTHAGGIRATVVHDHMARSILLEAENAAILQKAAQQIVSLKSEMQLIVEKTSRYAQLVEIHTQQVGSLLYVRFAFQTGDAAGHNMVTLAADRLIEWLLAKNPALKYVSISGNFCSDKKVSAVNGILGRGKYVIAEVIIPAALCRRFLKTTPEKIVQLHIKKNLIGNIVAGGLRTANAHFANMLLGFYLATGQDAANIIEGSQGIVHAEVRGQDLYFSVTLPNLIVGSVGNGKDLPFVQENLELLGCLAKRNPGENAKRLAIIAAAAVLCGELSLLAAQTNPGELMGSHLKWERSRSEKK